MLADINTQSYEIDENGKKYILRVGSSPRKVYLHLCTGEYNNTKNYAGEFTLNDLRRINRVFLLTPTIYDAKDEFDKAILRKKIGISETEDYVHLIFYMMIGTDTSTLSIALPRDETPRIIRLEERHHLAKLERDSMISRLGLLRKEIDEIRRDQDQVQAETERLQVEADQILASIPRFESIPRRSMKHRRPRMSAPEKSVVREEVITETQDFPRAGPQIPPGSQIPPGQSVHLGQSVQLGQSIPLGQSMQGQMISNPPARLSQLARFESGLINDIIKDEAEFGPVKAALDERMPGSNLKLIYKGTIDGDSARAFHAKCDAAPRTLVLVEDSAGNRFGGFTTEDWSGQYVQKKDPNAFIFSIDRGQIYPVLPDANAIGAYPNFGPVFFGCQIRLYDNFLTKGGTTFKRGMNYATNEDFELTNGSQAFGVRDVEVYEVY